KDKPKRARLIECSSRSGAWQKYKLDGEPMGRQFSASVPVQRLDAYGGWSGGLRPQAWLKNDQCGVVAAALLSI
ncbi:MAG: hypothetical protein ACRCVD_09830, partial [Halioglobus sp.]